LEEYSDIRVAQQGNTAPREREREREEKRGISSLIE
jgi:hypothetical protein